MEFSAAELGLAAGQGSSRPSRGCRPGFAACTFCGRSATIGFWAAISPACRVARSSGRASGGGGELLGDRGTAVRFEARRPRGGVRLTGTGSTVPVDRSSAPDRRGRASMGSVASLSAHHPTRLETRTKESNMRASHWAVRNPKAQ